MIEKKFYDWSWIDHQLEIIGEKLEKTNKPDYISGVPRGGLIPAVLASHKFGIQFIPLESAKGLSSSQRQNILVFDDIADSGETLLNLNIYGFLTATLAFRHNSKFLPDLIGEYINDDHWLVFPWEQENSKTIQDYLV